MNVSSTVTPRKRRDNSTARIVEHAYFLGHTADLVFSRRGNEYFNRRRKPRQRKATRTNQSATVLGYIVSRYNKQRQARTETTRAS
jgi:hypothetical protein